MNTNLKSAGVNLIIAGVLLTASRLISIIPIVNKWYQEDIIAAAQFSLAVAIVVFIVVIAAGGK